MRKIVGLGLALALCLTAENTHAQKGKTKKETPGKASSAVKPKLDNKKDKLSYAIAFNMAKQFASQKIEVNPDIFANAFLDIYKGGNSAMSEQEVMNTLQEFETEMRDKMQGDMKAAAGPNKEAGRKFLEENKKRAGVVELPSGLQYEILKDGNGQSPTASSTVTTHYTGTLMDGTVFDSSVERGQPAQFPVNGVIKGWTEALQLMKPGSKWKLYIPSDLAYGDGGSPPKIQPGATLIFEVELISVDK
jgi:FKBP-type peptidyl-prolyl cis-trans isomerase FklB